jgi:hypothetical protein
LPVVALLGTGTTILVAFQLLGVAAVPLKLTVPVAVPKFVPVMVMEAPGAPDIAERLAITGAVDVVLAGRISTALKL